MIDNYNKALSHPDVHDVEAVKLLVKSVFNFGCKAIMIILK